MLWHLHNLFSALQSRSRRKDATPLPNSDYPYPALTSLLQVAATPEEYLRLIPPSPFWRGGNIPPTAPYWSVVPVYTYTECPLCGRRYQEPADTYTLLGWSISAFSSTLYISRRYFRSLTWCPHFVGIQLFANFHQITPYELKYVQNNWGEVPYLTPWFLPDDLDSFAVLHALPICRIETAQFVPRYTLFILTYFSENGRGVLGRHYDREWARGAHDPEFYPSTLAPPGHKEGNLYNLPYWSASGRLGWLDFNDPDLPLRIGSSLEWPKLYYPIPGRQSAFNWRRDKWTQH